MYSPTERHELIGYLDRTRDELLSAVAGLSDAQLNFRLSPAHWSIADNVEHVALVEEVIGTRILQELISASSFPAVSSVNETDAAVLEKAVDRSVGIDSSAQFLPTGKPTAISLEHFLASQKKIVGFVRSTVLDLRQIITSSRMFGPVDGHQRLLGLAGHCARHTAQILETKSHPNFPAA